MGSVSLRFFLALILVASASIALAIQPFPLSDVSLADDSIQAEALKLNTDYLLMIPTDSLMWTFRENAGVEPPGKPLGGWENPACEVRGSILGHYLTAMALAYKHKGSAIVKERSDVLVTELRKVQEALGGYLSAFPTEHFDRLERLEAVWAPYYVIHKIMTGLLDQHELVGNQLAFTMALDMADYFSGRIKNVIQEKGLDYWHEVLNNEFGGMGEIMFRLYGHTKNETLRETGLLFDKPLFYNPLVKNQDSLPGLHANTHLAQVNAFAAQFEETGDEDAKAAVSNFFTFLVQNHSYATGGSNDHEYWGPPASLADTINPSDGLQTQESCTQYNTLKIARTLFRWTGDPAVADFYERAFLNGVLGVQRHAPLPLSSRKPLPDQEASRQAGASVTLNSTLLPQQAASYQAQLEAFGGRPADPNVVSWPEEYAVEPLGASALPDDFPPGIMIYFQPLGPGLRKGWGNPFDSFWCCYGTGIESFSKLADSIYFHNSSGQVPVLYVNQFVSSTLDWKELGAKIHQKAVLLGKGNVATMRLENEAGQGELALKLRVPGWTDASRAKITVNGEPWKECSQDEKNSSGVGELGSSSSLLDNGTFCTIQRVWSDGDIVEGSFPMTYRTEAINDRRQALRASTRAIMLGPVLMAGLTDGPNDVDADPHSIGDYISELPSSGCLVSLKLPSLTGPVHLRHVKGMVSTSQVRVGADAPPTTFRIVPAVSLPVVDFGISGASSADTAFLNTMLQQLCPGSQGPASEQLLKSFSTKPGVSSVLGVHLEAATASGFFLGLDSKGRMVLEQAEPEGVSSKRPHIFSLQAGSKAGDLGQNGKSRLSLAPMGPFSDAGLISNGEEAVWQGTNEGHESPLLLDAPLWQFPEGSKLLIGDNRKYILAPLMNIMDESYAAYFDFEAPSSDILAAATVF